MLFLKISQYSLETPVLESSFNKVAGQVFSCEYWKMFNNNYYEVRLRTAASATKRTFTSQETKDSANINMFKCQQRYQSKFLDWFDLYR